MISPFNLIHSAKSKSYAYKKQQLPHQFRAFLNFLLIFLQAYEYSC